MKALAAGPQVIARSGGAIARLQGEGTLEISRADAAAAGLYDEGTLSIGLAEVAAATDEHRVIGQPECSAYFPQSSSIRRCSSRSMSSRNRPTGSSISANGSSTSAKARSAS